MCGSSRYGEVKKERPQLKRELENISEYKKIVLIFPNWWGTYQCLCLVF